MLSLNGFHEFSSGWFSHLFRSQNVHVILRADRIGADIAVWNAASNPDRFRMAVAIGECVAATQVLHPTQSK
jgi:hypothetical protein